VTRGGGGRTVAERLWLCGAATSSRQGGASPGVKVVLNDAGASCGGQNRGCQRGVEADQRGLLAAGFMKFMRLAYVLAVSRVARSCIHRIHAKFGWILDQSVWSEMWFFVLSEIGNVQL
jgi:hypothetical protein